MPLSLTIYLVLQLLFAILNCGSSFPYVDLKYEALNDYLSALRGDYNYVLSANELFQLPPAKDGSLSCSPLTARISDLKSLRTDSSRPQILISGEIHGDERVGPSASLATAQLLVLSSECAIGKKAESCVALHSMSNVTAAQRNWLAFLATRRDTYVIPTANCLGYIQCKRNDGRVDPNRDFPYSRQDTKCMQSPTARLFRHIMAQNLVQVVVTFHSGMVAIGYEWGSRNHMAPKDRSPDDTPNKEIGDLMVSFGGAFRQERKYPVGRINSMVYPVDGGMEDWLYAAGWDPALLKHCDGPPRRTLRGLHGDDGLKSGAVQDQQGRSLRNATRSPFKSRRQQQAVGKEAENRALVFLVETSNAKVIHDDSLGDSLEILDGSAEQNGHVPRNVRLSLLAIDMLQPYVCIDKVRLSVTDSQQEQPEHHHHHSNKTYPPASRHNISIANTSFVNSTTVPVVSAASTRILRNESVSPAAPPTVLTANSGLHVQWYVGGSSSVDATFLAWHRPVATKDGLRDRSSLPSTVDWTTYHDSLLTTQTEQYFDHAFNQSDKSRNEEKRSGDGFPALASELQSGFSRWRSGGGAEHAGSSHDHSNSSVHYHSADPMRPLTVFSATVRTVYNFASHPPSTEHTLSAARTFQAGRYWLVVWALVDSGFGATGQGEPANMPPQSHYSNARTNVHWRHSIGDRVVKGRRYWPSDPIVVVVRRDGSFYLESEVLHCNYWDRTLLHSEPAANSSNANVSSGNSSVSGAGNVTDEFLWSEEAEMGFVDILQESVGARPHKMVDPQADYSAQQRYLGALIVLILLIVGFSALLSYWRRNRIYSSVLNNKYVNVNTSSSNSSLEKMKLINKSPART